MATQLPQLNDHDLELLSSYIDGQLGADERREIERRLRDDAALRRAYDELRATVQALRDLEPLRPPRSFTFDPAVVAPPQPAARLGWGRLLQVAGVFAAILIAAIGTLSVLGSLGAGAPQMAAAPTVPAVAPMVAAAPTVAPAATMAPLSARENAPAPAAGAPAITSDQAAGAPALESAPEASPLATPAAAAAAEPAPEAAPAQTVATPAISSPGTTDLVPPTPAPESPAPAAAGPDVLLILMIAVVVVLAGGGVWLWRRSRSAQ